MTYQWIFDVLGDLKTFSMVNGLTDLADQIDRTIAVAAADVTRASGGTVVIVPPADPAPAWRGGDTGGEG